MCLNAIERSMTGAHILVLIGCSGLFVCAQTQACVVCLPLVPQARKDPAFVPREGKFFMHDDRRGGKGRGRGRGYWLLSFPRLCALELSSLYCRGRRASKGHTTKDELRTSLFAVVAPALLMPACCNFVRTKNSYGRGSVCARISPH